MTSEDRAATVAGLVAQQFAGKDYKTLKALVECSSAFRESVLPALYSHLEAHHLAHPRLLETFELQPKRGTYVKSAHWDILQCSNAPRISRKLSRLYSEYQTSVRQRYVSKQKSRASLLLTLATLSQFRNLLSLTLSITTVVDIPPPDDVLEDAEMIEAPADSTEDAQEGEQEPTAEEMEAAAERDERSLIDQRQSYLLLPSLAEWQDMPLLSTLESLRFNDPHNRHDFRVHYDGLTGLPDLLSSLCSIDLLGCSIFSLGTGLQPEFISRITHFSHTGMNSISGALSALAPQLQSLHLRLTTEDSKEIYTIADFVQGPNGALPIFPRLKSLTLSNIVMGPEIASVWTNVLDCLPACESISITRLMQYFYREKGKPAPIRPPYLDPFANGLAAATNFALTKKLSVDISCNTFPSYISDKVALSTISALNNDVRVQTVNLQWDLGDSEEMLATLRLDEDDMYMLSNKDQLNIICSALTKECAPFSEVKGKALRLKAGFEHFCNDGVDIESVKVFGLQVDSDGEISCG